MAKGRQEGRQEGELRGKIALIEQLLAAGSTWQLITQATGLTPERFAALKAERERLTAAPPSSSPSPSATEA